MIALVDLIDEHPDAVAHDLIRCGLRLRDLPSPALLWGDLLSLVRAAQPESAIYRAMNPAWQHTHDLELLRRIDAHLAGANWQRAMSRRAAPDPYRFPWEVDEGVIRGEAMTMDEAADFLGWTQEMREHLDDN